MLLKMASSFKSVPKFILIILYPCATRTTVTRLMRFTHHTQARKFSFVYPVAARITMLVAQRLRTSVLRYYCFSIV